MAKEASGGRIKASQGKDHQHRNGCHKGPGHDRPRFERAVVLTPDPGQGWLQGQQLAVGDDQHRPEQIIPDTVYCPGGFHFRDQ